jgi:hypothetical protein
LLLLSWDADSPDQPDREAVAMRHQGNQVNQRPIFDFVCCYLKPHQFGKFFYRLQVLLRGVEADAHRV